MIKTLTRLIENKLDMSNVFSQPNCWIKTELSSIVFLLNQTVEPCSEKANNNNKKNQFLSPWPFTRFPTVFRPAVGGQARISAARIKSQSVVQISEKCRGLMKGSHICLELLDALIFVDVIWYLVLFGPYPKFTLSLYSVMRKSSHFVLSIGLLQLEAFLCNIPEENLVIDQTSELIFCVANERNSKFHASWILLGFWANKGPRWSPNIFCLQHILMLSIGINLESLSFLGGVFNHVFFFPMLTRILGYDLLNISCSML